MTTWLCCYWEKFDAEQGQGLPKSDIRCYDLFLSMMNSFYSILYIDIWWKKYQIKLHISISRKYGSNRSFSEEFIKFDMLCDQEKCSDISDKETNIDRTSRNVLWLIKKKSLKSAYTVLKNLRREVLLETIWRVRYRRLALSISCWQDVKVTFVCFCLFPLFYFIQCPFCILQGYLIGCA